MVACGVRQDFSAVCVQVVGVPGTGINVVVNCGGNVAVRCVVFEPVFVPSFQVLGLRGFRLLYLVGTDGGSGAQKFPCGASFVHWY